ncbi:homoserine kinase [Clostridium botulinum]|uniref:Homoserine kinase n=1 Tax=Clostridium botulinum (strain Langeland / NCTC 10281 / Type F) TaxID=441772 RepID=KHSE_CLOBL|nr:homoserine kinase [Clostridium botulinum]A7GDW6.1 RecName: Full=Homoserine kinase; Short=HK; Short=HSK [Clostridium botulinum F str. Langeland]ABS39991.1 homoserine kinase [Clostridium botulinum F str. Langeland]ADF99412.1 homoserine kinase [Clostridium botulinum F str. 230613]KKM43018.1 serine kinase [Clostridium botulinum]MBY6791469.1 homoserine kinase [Clostridium botulinum]MBY6936700.1 homoserine kinase [Clostridium botulinum]
MVEVRVPATSANIGPGFDCLGVAVNIYNKFFVEEVEEGIIFEGCADKFKNENNLIYVAMKKCFDKIGYKPTGLRIKIESDIPVSRGLGSSAACVVGGIVSANELAGGALNKKELLDLAVEVEGHPDNVNPAFCGGMTASISDNREVIYSKVKVSEGIKFCALIPDFTLSTEKARAVLPKSIDYKDGIFNVGRTALMISALNNGDFHLIKYACKDKLHQDYRAKLIENFYSIKKQCEKLNSLGVFLSGAGPTIMVMLREEDKDFSKNIKSFLETLKNKWEVRELKIDKLGTVVNNRKL